MFLLCSHLDVWDLKAAACMFWVKQIIARASSASILKVLNVDVSSVSFPKVCVKTEGLDAGSPDTYPWTWHSLTWVIHVDLILKDIKHFLWDTEMWPWHEFLLMCLFWNTIYLCCCCGEESMTWRSWMLQHCVWTADVPDGKTTGSTGMDDIGWC